MTNMEKKNSALKKRSVQEIKRGKKFKKYHLVCDYVGYELKTQMLSLRLIQDMN